MTDIDLQVEIKKAYDAVNAAWNAVAHVQNVMRDTGVPDAVVAMLDETRLRCSNTSAFPQVVDVIAWGQGDAPSH